MLSAFLVRYYVPVEGRARRLVLPFPPADWDALRELLPDTDWHVPQRGTALPLAGAGRSATPGTCWRASASSRSRPRSGPRIRSTPSAAISGSASCRGAWSASTSPTTRARDTVGSLVWFEAGRPKKSEYRKFKIQGLGQQDDFAAIQEVLTRYLTRRRDEQLAAAGPHRDRRRQGAAERGAARPRTALGLERHSDRQSRQAGGGGLSARTGREPASARGGARRCGCCSGRGTRRTASAWPTTESGAPSARSPPSCSTSPASGPTPAATAAGALRQSRGCEVRLGLRARDRAGILHPPGGAGARAPSDRAPELA